MKASDRLQILAAAVLPDRKAKAEIFRLVGRWNGEKKSVAKKFACRENAKKPRKRNSETFADAEKQLELFR